MLEYYYDARTHERKIGIKYDVYDIVARKMYSIKFICFIYFRDPCELRLCTLSDKVSRGQISLQNLACTVASSIHGILLATAISVCSLL